jgi:hypothetical protein
MISRILYGLVALAFLSVGGYDTVMCVAGFDLLKAGLLHNHPLFLDFNIMQEHRFPGRITALLMITIPFVAFWAGFVFARLACESDRESGVEQYRFTE